MRRVVVTGMGLLTPLRCGVEHVWERLLKGESSATKITRFDTSDYSTGYAMALGVVSGVLQARATGKGLLMQTSLLAQALSMQAMQVTRVENDLSPAQKWINEKNCV